MSNLSRKFTTIATVYRLLSIIGIILSFNLNIGVLSLTFRSGSRLLSTTSNGLSDGRRVLINQLANICCNRAESIGYRGSSSALLSSIEDNEATVDSSPSLNLTQDQSQRSVASLVISDFHVLTRDDVKDEIRHVELYLKRRKGGLWWAFLIRFLPQFLRPKPSAKTGVRTYISSSVMMDNLVAKCFGEGALLESETAMKTSKNNINVETNDTDINGRTIENGSKTISGGVRVVSPTSTGSANIKWAAKNDKESVAVVGLFVYMWITPLLRRRQLGNHLFEIGKQLCRDLGASFMILVHDDNGSGNLVKYYEDREFKPIFDVIDKGMLGKL